MTESQKKIAIICVVVVAVFAAAFSGYNAMAPEKEKVVGTLPMAEGGGRDAEKGAAQSGAADPSGMPAGVARDGR